MANENAVVVKVGEKVFIKGDQGAVFVPELDDTGILSWTNDGGLPNPAPRNIQGKSAYDLAVEGGYPGTEEEFNADLALFKPLSEAAVAAKDDAVAAKERAVTAEASAEASATSASGSASSASTSADNASSSASQAASSAGTAVTAAATATTKANAAAASANDAGGYATSAGAASSAAISAKEDAVSAKTSAQASASSAADSAGSASSSATSASSSATTATSAATSATAAQTAAEAAQTAAETAAESIEESAAQIAQNTADIAALDAEVADQKSAIEDLQALTNRKAGILVDTASGAIASFVPDSTIDNLLGVSVAVEPVQAGSGAPSPDNVRPISGWSAVGIGNSASNLIDASAVANGFLQPADGVVYDNQNWNVTPFIPARGGDYTLSWDSAVSTYQGTICAYDANQHYITGVNWSGGAFSHTFTLPFGTSYLRASWSVVVSGNPAVRNNIRLNFGSVDLGYTPYATGNTYTITLGQTVYGGTLDVTNGTMTVDRVCKTLSTARNLSSAYLGSIIYNRSSPETSDADFTKPFSCNRLKYVGYDPASTNWKYGTCINATQGSFNLWISDTAFASLADATTFLANNETQICYYLATPVTIQLDPVAISTISGQTNNVWSDAGAVEVTYAADIKAYIDRMNQSPEDDMIANTLIAANKYFTINNRLFLSTASIAAGAQIIPGHNCTETSLVEALNALNA